MENINPENYDVSQVGVQFGEDFEPDGKSSIKLQLSFSAEEIKKQTDLLKNYSKNTTDLTNSLVLELPVESTEIHEALSTAFEEFLKNKKLTGRVERENPKVIVLVLKLGGEKEDFLLQPLKFLIGQGLSNISKDSASHLNFNLSSASDFKDLLPYLSDNESIIATFLQSSKFEIKLALARNLVEGLSKVFSKIDPEFNNSPPMMLLKYFKNVDVDLRFQSTKELPKNLRDILFYPKFLKGISEETRKLKAIDPNTNVIIEKLAAQAKGFIIIPDLLVGRIELNLPNASVFVKEYFGIANYF